VGTAVTAGVKRDVGKFPRVNVQLQTSNTSRIAPAIVVQRQTGDLGEKCDPTVISDLDTMGSSSGGISVISISEVSPGVSFVEGVCSLSGIEVAPQNWKLAVGA